MKISSMKYFLSDSLKSLNRNKTLSIASAATVAAALFILGIFVLAGANVSSIIKNVESQVEVELFLKDDIKSSEQTDIENKIKEDTNVASYIYKDKAAALERFKAMLGDENQGIVEGFDKTNPLPMSYVVKLKNPEMVSNFVDGIKSMKGIDAIGDKRDLVNKIIAVTTAVKWVGVVVFIILGGVALFLIGNTIKITVYSRRREISIMKFIGATDWFIRWPFILEGMIIGTIGALISVVLLFYAYKFIVMNVGTYFITLVPASYVITNLLWAFALGGILIGSIGSIFAIRKFLIV